jgi:hypothetical protein
MVVEEITEDATSTSSSCSTIGAVHRRCRLVRPVGRKSA